MKRKTKEIERALKMKTKVWCISIKFKEYLKTDEQLRKEDKYFVVYVMDNSMYRAITKAIYYFKRRTGIKYLKITKFYERDYIKIMCRRATKIEMVNVNAGYGHKDAYGHEALKVII